jgi:hypothetical protein
MSAPTTSELARWRHAAGELGIADTATDDTMDDAACIDMLTELRRLEHAVVAAQARMAHRFEESQRAAQRAAGTPAKQVGRGIAEQVALARHESPARARVFLGTARILNTEMPHTERALSNGDIDGWTATLLVRETAELPLAVRTAVDTELVGSEKAASMSRKELVDQARKIAIRLDNAGVAERQRIAEKERRVTIRPAPDLMTYVTALVPLAQGVAMYAALSKAADSARAPGDERTKGQVMADMMSQLVTGRGADVPPPVDVHLVMTDRTLLARDESMPAYLPGYGIVPGEWARALVAEASGRTAAWVKRLWVAPTTGELMAMDSRRRKAPTGLGEFIRDRDRWCRTPWCGAPIRHIDHPEPYRDTGVTEASGLQGLCVSCNQAKEAMGWVHLPRAGPPHRVEITTPTGHTYLSFPPPPLVGGDEDAA